MDEILHISRELKIQQRQLSLSPLSPAKNPQRNILSIHSAFLPLILRV